MLSILLRCNGFAGIQKATVDQTGTRPPNSDHDLFLMQVLERALELLLCQNTELVITGCPIKSTFVIHHNPIKKSFVVVACNKRRHFKTVIFLIFGQLMRHPLIKFFQLSNLQNDHRMVLNAE